jgi:tetratricopeptide (TPR) repeat protein
LERQQQALPLLFAPETDVWERVGKFQKRNPGLLANLFLVVLLVGVVAVGALWQNASQQTRTMLAQQSVGDFERELSTARVRLVSWLDLETHERVQQQMADWLTKYRVGQLAAWANQDSVRRLPTADQQRLRSLLGETALLLAESQLATANTQPERQDASLAQAIQWNRLAEQCFSVAPAVLWDQRQQLAQLRPQTQWPSRTPTELPADAAVDWFVRGIRKLSTGDVVQAGREFQKLTQNQPTHYAGQFFLAYCWQAQGDWIRATERYTVAQSLAPQDWRPSYSRALVLVTKGESIAAEEALNAAVQLAPREPVLLYQRGLVRARLKKWDAAEADFTQLIEQNAFLIPSYTKRAVCRQHLGQAPAAEADREAAKNLVPRTAADYVARSHLQLSTDKPAALKDIEHATRLQPLSASAWQTKSHILADHLEENALALEAQRRVVTARPCAPIPRAGVAVLLARLGHREDAHQQIQQAVQLSRDPMVAYLAACTYSLTAKTEPDDLTLALKYLRQAMREGYRDFVVIEDDPDLANLRALPEYTMAVNSAKEFVK